MASRKGNLPDTTAEEQLKELDSAGGDRREALEEQAKEQKKTQREEMSAKPIPEEKGQKTDNPLQARRTAHVQMPGSAKGAGIFPDQMSRRSDSDAVYGGYVSVTGGEHQGTHGVYIDNAAFDDEGYPTAIIVRTRDSAMQNIVVAYDDVAAAGPRGRD